MNTTIFEEIPRKKTAVATHRSSSMAPDALNHPENQRQQQKQPAREEYPGPQKRHGDPIMGQENPAAEPASENRTRGDDALLNMESEPQTESQKLHGDPILEHTGELSGSTGVAAAAKITDLQGRRQQQVDEEGNPVGDGYPGPH